jgi:hypothetical protein
MNPIDIEQIVMGRLAVAGITPAAAANVCPFIVGTLIEINHSTVEAVARETDVLITGILLEAEAEATNTRITIH